MSYFVPSLKPTTSSQAFNTVMTSLPPRPFVESTSSTIILMGWTSMTLFAVYLTPWALKDWSISCQGWASHSLPTSRSLLEPKSTPRSQSHPHLSFLCVKEHINTTQTYIGQHVTCPSNTLLALLKRRLAKTMWQGHPSTVCPWRWRHLLHLIQLPPQHSSVHPLGQRGDRGGEQPLISLLTPLLAQSPRELTPLLVHDLCSLHHRYRPTDNASLRDGHEVLEWSQLGGYVICLQRGCRHQVKGRKLDPVLVRLKSLLSPCSREIQTMIWPFPINLQYIDMKRTEVVSAPTILYLLNWDLGDIINSPEILVGYGSSHVDSPDISCFSRWF